MATADHSRPDSYQRPPAAVLLVNLGTPDAPTKPAIRRYLREFLSDRRVVETPKLLWWLILNGIILRFRPAKLLKNYQLIWQAEDDSPIRTITNRQVDKLQARLTNTHPDCKVYAAMTYGQPSIENALDKIAQDGFERVVVLPLYPQYSATTTAATWDALNRVLAKRRNLPAIEFIKRYHRHPAYIEAMANSVREHWQKTARQGTLLMSFHGIPKAYVDKGDPYLSDCKETAQLLADQLGLGKEQWLMTFQSRVGAAEWLQPYTDATMQKLGESTTRSLDVICPGFSADCLETIEEIDEENREIFEKAGGTDFHYIPALNDRDDHADAMAAIVTPYL